MSSPQAGSGLCSGQGLCSSLTFACCGTFPATELLLWLLSPCLAAVSIKLQIFLIPGAPLSQSAAHPELLALLKVCPWYRGVPEAQSL